MDVSEGFEVEPHPKLGVKGNPNHPSPIIYNKKTIDVFFLGGESRGKPHFPSTDSGKSAKTRSDSGTMGRSQHQVVALWRGLNQHQPPMQYHENKWNVSHGLIWIWFHKSCH
jgi:hypothetical protein